MSANESGGALRHHLQGMAIGAGLALLATGFSMLGEARDPLAFHAILLTAIASVYLGFAIADGRRSSIAVQIVSVLVFFSVAYYGFEWDSRVLLGAGFIAHGLWDWVHHDHHGPTRVMTWYPPFCAVADIVLGIPLLAGWVGT